MKKNSVKQKILRSPSDKVKKKLSYAKSEEIDKFVCLLGPGKPGSYFILIKKKK